MSFKAVHNILMNRYYIGVVEYMGVEHEGAHEPLVSTGLSSVCKSHWRRGACWPSGHIGTRTI